MFFKIDLKRKLLHTKFAIQGTILIFLFMEQLMLQPVEKSRRKQGKHYKSFINGIKLFPGVCNVLSELQTDEISLEVEGWATWE